ncbi:MAG: type I DNA topoisomerase [bacterium]
MKLIIVESPTKAKTIKNYAGKDFKVISSKGHIIDLPAKELGIDIEGGFIPKFKPIPSKKKAIQAISKESKSADSIFIATDPDREGEAIAYFVNSVIDPRKKDSTKRVLFYEITKKGITNGLSNPRDINQNLVNAQFARRMLDRIVGYKISPFLWQTIARDLSAGRVQSVALRLICEKEEKIKAFIPKEYYKISGMFPGDKDNDFKADLIKLKGKNVKDVKIQNDSDIRDYLMGQQYAISLLETKKKKQHPLPPFITSTLQQTASNVYNFSAKRTMSTAQKLYEGIEIDGKLTGLITYMRTDSTRLSDESLDSMRDYIKDNLGDRYLPQKARFFKKAKRSQDAHEAIRPTDINLTPQKVQGSLNKSQFKLYSLIWSRALASQMNPAEFSMTKIELTAEKNLFRSIGNILLFDGFLKIYPYSKSRNTDNTIPDLDKEETLKLISVDISREKTKPPARYTEAKLVKTLEKEGIGRPSTYAQTIDTLLRKEYVSKLNKQFTPTDLGMTVNRVLVKHFPDIINVNFTAEMEDKLDSVEDNDIDYVKMLSDFYEDFKKVLAAAMDKAKDIKKGLQEKTDIKCEKCGAPMVIKWGKFGKFLACSNYPECKSTKPLNEEKITDEQCPQCGKELIIKRGRYGRFVACSDYPNCKFTKPVSTGIKCPECSKGELIEKQSRKGRIFWGCSNYPDCKFATWYKPVKKACPECSHPYMELRRDKLVCPKCKHREEPEE